MVDFLLVIMCPSLQRLLLVFLRAQYLG
uniref:Uncharacterized protein n=1 Tax=Anguilla anguilla TaxID=7936 RepID=A0A0E9VWE7_ANGAN